MATIEYFRLEMKPRHFMGVPERVIEMRLVVNGRAYKKFEWWQPDDTMSFLDYLLDQAKAEFRKAICDQQEQAQSQ